MENHKVIVGYWPVTNLAQAIRYLLAILHINFEDRIYADPTKWAKDKETLGAKFPNLPYLIDGSTILTESTAILRYLAKKNHRQDLLGKTSEDYALVETYIGVMKDILEGMWPLRTMEDPKPALPGIYDKIKGKLELIESNLKGNSVTGYLTIADLRIATFAPFLFIVFGNHANNYPGIQSVVDHVENLSQVKEYRKHGVTQVFPPGIAQKFKQ